MSTSEEKRLRQNAATRKYVKSPKGSAVLAQWNASERGRKSKRASQAASRARNRTIIRFAKNAPCVDCLNSYPYYIMDFDHRIPSTKSFSIGACPAVSVERLLAEIAKCDAVCANCHRERTEKQRQDRRTVLHA